ncbi:MAG: hypothetical protein GXP31_09590 [Kiritimatiellaeota bacterium]|nr:hypothetical protein [Kiritimatiellota bacterium]
MRNPGRPHTLRRFPAVPLLANSADIRGIQELFGHVRHATTHGRARRCDLSDSAETPRGTGYSMKPVEKDAWARASTILGENPPFSAQRDDPHRERLGTPGGLWLRGTPRPRNFRPFPAGIAGGPRLRAERAAQQCDPRDRRDA